MKNKKWMAILLGGIMAASLKRRGASADRR